MAPRRVAGDVMVDELESNLGKFVRIDDIQDAYSSDGDENSDEECEELEPYGSESLKKSACRPPSDEEDNEPETALSQLFCEEPPSSRSIHLVSAMKGSREKQGASPRKLAVTWAPGVYDPIPSSLSHAVKGKQRKSRKDRDKDNNNYNKKGGKKGQKGSSSRGAGGKDKKQYRKLAGRSDKCYKTMDASDDLDDFDVGSPDYCGSSFLKTSMTKVHYSATEAL